MTDQFVELMTRLEEADIKIGQLEQEFLARRDEILRQRRLISAKLGALLRIANDIKKEQK